MKILIVGDFLWEIYEQSFCDAFNRLGIDVYTFKWKEYNYRGSNPVLKYSDKVQNRLLIGPKINRENRDLLEYACNIKPDLIFIYRGTHIYANTIKKIKVIGCKVFSYHNDDPFSGIPSKSFNRHYLKSAFICDHNFVYRKKNVKDFNKLGITNTSVLLPYYIPESNFPIECQKEYDIAFIGHFENDGRDKYIKALVDANINITVFGGEIWKRAPLYDEIKAVIEGKKEGNEYNITLNKAKIALVFLSKINQDTYTRRNFEIPATKTLMLSEYTEDLNSMFEADKEAVYFKNPEDLVVKCKSLLKEDQKLKEIGDEGHKRLVSSGHSINDRANHIINFFMSQK